jgi:hypothetical protein
LVIGLVLFAWVCGLVVAEAVLVGIVQLLRQFGVSQTPDWVAWAAYAALVATTIAVFAFGWRRLRAGFLTPPGDKLLTCFSWSRKAKWPAGAGPAGGQAPWLDGYGGQTTPALIGLGETHRIDSVVLAFEEAISAKAERLGAGELTTAELVVLAVEAVEREVNNGGFDQLFRNWSKEDAPNYVSALVAIGRPDVAELARQAIEALRLGKLPMTTESIDRVMDKDSDARDARFEELDDRYMEIAGDLAPPLFAFIKANSAEITIP